MPPTTPSENRKLGKLPPKHDRRTLRLARYLKPGALPQAPATCEYASKVAAWPMMKNDAIGDCGVAGPGHMIQQWTTYSGAPFVPSDAQIVQAYSAISGYDPATGANDNGVAMLDMLNYWRRAGIAGRKIRAFAALEPGNQIHVEETLFLFGNIACGLALPAFAGEEEDLWSIPPTVLPGEDEPGSWGGHMVPIVTYDRLGLTCVTWGGLMRMTWPFFRRYCDEAYAVLSDDWIDTARHLSASNFDLAALTADLPLVAG
jgi:hypothetical protein